MIGISACLIGDITTYKNTHNLQTPLLAIDSHLFVKVCPEVMGGLSIPRPPAEIVCENPLAVINNQSEDVTKEYQQGSLKALDYFLKNNVQVAMLKKNSPSCGYQTIYDGTFSHTLTYGHGTFARLCEQHHIKIFNETQIDEFFEYLKQNNLI